MITLYLDNFRGFHKTWLPLNDVNFFVGENSTGKTSVMSLFYLFSTQRFWNDFDFASDYGIDLGLYDEITRTDEFTIGFVNDAPEYIWTDIERVTDNAYAIFLTFTKDKDGSPRIREYRGFINQHSIHFVIADDNHRILFKVLKERYKKQGLLNYLYLQWKKESIKQHKGYKTEKPIRLVSNSEKRIKLTDLGGAIIMEFLKAGKVEKDKSLLHILNTEWILPVSVCWLAPVRSKPQRIYERRIRDFTPEGDHIPFLLRDLMQQDSSQSQKIRDILNAFGRDSGLFQELGVKKFGDDKYAPFEVQILLDGQPAKITNVGYGISQVLPLIVEILLHEKEEWFALQQPEVHLHPKAQAFVGEFIFYQAKTDKQGFIVETHSDFILDRFRLAMKRFSEKSPDQENTVKAQILFFERTETGNTIHSIGIAPDGSYLNEPPASFREFFINESLEIIGL